MSDPSPVPYRSSRWPARLIASTGLFHNVVGLLIKDIRKPFIDAILSGYVGQFNGAKRLHSFWFFFGGVSMMLMGRMIDLHLFPEDEPPTVKNGIKEDSSANARRHTNTNRSGAPRSGRMVLGNCSRWSSRSSKEWLLSYGPARSCSPSYRIDDTSLSSTTGVHRNTKEILFLFRIALEHLRAILMLMM